MTCQVCAHDCCRAERQLRVGQRTRTRRTACGRELLRRWIHLMFAGSRQRSLRRGAASLYGRGRSIERFLAQSRVLLAGSVSSQPSSLSYLVRLPPEAGNQNHFRYHLLAARHRPQQPSSSAASHRPRIRWLLAAGRVLSRARVTAAKRTLDRFRPVAYDVDRGRWRSPCRRSPCRRSRAFSKHSIPVSPVVFGSVRSRLPR